MSGSEEIVPNPPNSSVRLTPISKGKMMAVDGRNVSPSPSSDGIETTGMADISPMTPAANSPTQQTLGDHTLYSPETPGNRTFLTYAADDDVDKRDCMTAEESALRDGGSAHPDDGGSSSRKAPEGQEGSWSYREEGEENSGGRYPMLFRVLDKITFMFPKIEPLPWGTFFVLSAVCAVPAAVYIVFFTTMGFGLDTFYYLSEHYEEYASALMGALVVFLLVLYLLDFSYWDSRWGIICREMSVVLLFSGFILLVLFIAADYPYGPICLFTILTPIWLVAAKMLFFAKKNTRTFVSWLSGPLFFISILTGLVWMAWTFWREENEWNETTRVRDAEESGCEADFGDDGEYDECRKEPGSDDVCFVVEDSSPDIKFPDGCAKSCTKVFDDCLNTFILWVGPLLVSMSLFFLSFFCTFLRSEGGSEREILNFGKLWIFLLFAMWVSASLAGTASGVTAALAALTLASFVGSAVFMSVSFRRDEQRAHARQVWERIKAKYGGQIDVVKGLFIVTCAPVVVVYLFLSFLNQCVRRLRCFPCSLSLPPADAESLSEDRKDARTDWITERTREQVDAFKSWDRSKVYTYAVYWGIAFMTLQVIVAQFTLLFLSWLIEETSDMSLAAVTGIMIGVGLCMFLLPPVPGVPIYLTLGIVILAIGRDTMGIVGSLLYGSAVSLLLKLFACAVQQKVIGENLSHYVSVRQFVSINSKLIRAMRLVLSQRGLGLAKVAILIGGPDWPTSVLCGIMRLNLLQILIGTLPIIFLIVPTMLTGSFTYMASLELDDGTLEFPWAGTLATIFASLTAIVQFGSMIVAAFYLEQTAAQRGEELEAIPLDTEVKEADDRAARKKVFYTQVTQWEVVPLWAKLTLTLSLICMITCCYMVQIFQNDCFADYELTYTIDEDLDGDWTNLVLPLGTVSIILFLVSMLLLYVFITWAKYKASKVADGSVVSPESGIELNAVDGQQPEQTATEQTVEGPISPISQYD